MREVSKNSGLENRQRSYYKEISAMLGLHRDVYSRYEKGLRDFPIDILIKLADTYHCSIDYLVGRVDTK